MKAQYYIYRNLRTKGFSVRYKGRVIDRLFTLTAYDVYFKVNQAGRQRVLYEKQKNVHAFVVCDKYINEKYPLIDVHVVDKYSKVKYNPYKAGCFVCDDNPIINAREVAFQNGQCLLVK
jgi:hypothetical protein